MRNLPAPDGTRLSRSESQFSRTDHWGPPQPTGPHIVGPMFLVTVTYTAPLDEVDRWRPAHGDWLNQLMSQQLLLVVGRRVPLVGGVYLVPEMPAAELDRLLATDPYVLNGVATHSVVAFTPLLVAPGLEDLKDS